MSASSKNVLVFFLLLECVCSLGCSTLGTVAYLIAPNDVSAEFKGLLGKHVAVVCRPIVELEFSDAGSARELARVTGVTLSQNVKKSRIIDQQEIVRWIDENNWVDYPTLGKSLDADLIVGIDLEEFRLYEGATLYRGRATAHVRVYDVSNNRVVFEKRFDDSAVDLWQTVLQYYSDSCHQFLQ